MKISKERLVEIIKEEVERSQEPQGSVKALGQFSAKLMQLSKEIKSAKGLDPKEMSEILEIFVDLVKYSSGTSGASLVSQISDLVDKKTGSK